MENNDISAESRFLASALHEIRTPIQTIISTVELLRETNLDAEQSEYVHQIDFSANILLQLASDVLDFTKIQSNELELENVPLNVVDIIESIMDQVSIEAFNKELEVITNIDYSIPTTVMGDPTRIQQVLLNLVKNAVKFTEVGYFMVNLKAHSNDLYFEVVDSGIGISEDKKDLIFKEFYQIDASTARKYGGTGLGLSISKKLVEAMGGQIGVRNNPQGGSIFWFSIPLKTADISVEEMSHITVSRDTRVLLVDDSLEALKCLSDKLLNFGLVSIDTATSGEQALQMLKSAASGGTPYSIVYVDMIMPKMDGWRFASELNNDHSIPKLKKILIIPEGQINGDAKMKILDWYNGYIYKPLKKTQLLATLQDNKTIYVESPKPAVQSAGDKHYNCKVLIAEDHPVNRKIIETFLQRLGAQTILAEDGEEAVVQIEQNPDVDIIFMDILMPKKSGLDATVELRHKNYQGIIIACTANSDPADFLEYKNLGINDILIKPFKKEAIKLMLEKWSAVLSFPEAKSIINIANINNTASEIWDMNDFMDTVKGDEDLAVSLMEEYIDQTRNILEDIGKETSSSNPDYKTLARLGHTIKGSSLAVSVSSLAEYGKQINDAAVHRDIIKAESMKTNSLIDLQKLSTIVENWKTSLKRN